MYDSEKEHLDKPAVVIELKWDKSTVGALSKSKKELWKCLKRISRKAFIGWY